MSETFDIKEPDVKREDILLLEDSDFIAQADWNRDTFESLDPQKGNVYEIKYQYLGFGNIDFYVEGNNGFVLVHRLEYVNKNILPSAHFIHLSKIIQKVVYSPSRRVLISPVL